MIVDVYMWYCSSVKSTFEIYLTLNVGIQSIRKIVYCRHFEKIFGMHSVVGTEYIGILDFNLYSSFQS